MTNKNEIVSPMYDGLAGFLTWRDEFMAEYAKAIIMQQAQIALYTMNPQALIYLMLSSPQGLESLMKIAKGG